MDIQINNLQNHKIALNLKQNAQVILKALEAPDAELSIVLLNDDDITELNQRYFNRQGPTNVISFPMNTGQFVEMAPQVLGDVVISVETAVHEAKTADITTDERMLQLLVHGILHLFGYDHEVSANEEARMESKANQLMFLVAKID